MARSWRWVALLVGILGAGALAWGAANDDPTADERRLRGSLASV